MNNSLVDKIIPAFLVVLVAFVIGAIPIAIYLFSDEYYEMYQKSQWFDILNIEDVDFDAEDITNAAGCQNVDSDFIVENWDKLQIVETTLGYGRFQIVASDGEYWKDRSLTIRQNRIAMGVNEFDSGLFFWWRDEFICEFH